MRTCPDCCPRFLRRALDAARSVGAVESRDEVVVVKCALDVLTQGRQQVVLSA